MDLTNETTQKIQKDINHIAQKMIEGEFDEFNFFTQHCEKIGLNYALVCTAMHGKVDLLKKLVEIGSDINIYKIILLHKACEHGHWEIEKYLMENEKINLDFALVCAIRYDRFDLVKKLVEMNTDVYLNTKALLNMICKYCRSEIVEFLVVNEKINMNYVANYAAKYGRVDLLKKIVEMGYNIHKNKRFLLYNASEYGKLKVEEYLMEILIVDDEMDLYNTYKFAARSGKINLLKKLVEVGYDIHAQSQVSFRIACQYNHLEIAEYLMINVKLDLCSALVCIAEHGRVDFLKKLIQAGYNINSRENIFLLLIVAGKHDHLEIAEYLIVTMKSCLGFALTYATRFNKIDFLKKIVEMGYDIHSYKNLLLCIACDHGHSEIEEYLVETLETNLDQAFICSVRYGRIDLLKKLVKMGYGTHPKNNETALNIACERNHLEIAEYLIVNGRVDLDCALVCVARHGKINLLKKLVEMHYVVCGIDMKLTHITYKYSYFEIANIACKYDHFEIVKYLVDTGKIDLDYALACAKGYDKADLVKKLVAMGSNNEILVQIEFKYQHSENDKTHD